MTASEAGRAPLSRSWGVEHEEIIGNTAADAYAASQDNNAEEYYYDDGSVGISNAYDDVSYFSLSKLPNTMVTDVGYSLRTTRARQAEHHCRAWDSPMQT